jgi:positive regulator of sigma E activity
MFIALLGLAIFLVGSILTNLVLEIIIPHRGWAVDENGKRLGRVMDFSVFLGIPVGIILAWLTLRLYRRKIKQNTIVETACAILYTLATTVIYIIYEIQ